MSTPPPTAQPSKLSTPMGVIPWVVVLAALALAGYLFERPASTPPIAERSAASADGDSASAVVTHAKPVAPGESIDAPVEAPSQALGTTPSPEQSDPAERPAPPSEPMMIGTQQAPGGGVQPSPAPPSSPPVPQALASPQEKEAAHGHKGAIPNQVPAGASEVSTRRDTRPGAVQPVAPAVHPQPTQPSTRGSAPAGVPSMRDQMPVDTDRRTPAPYSYSSPRSRWLTPYPPYPYRTDSGWQRIPRPYPYGPAYPRPQPTYPRQ